MKQGHAVKKQEHIVMTHDVMANLLPDTCCHEHVVPPTSKSLHYFLRKHDWVLLHDCPLLGMKHVLYQSWPHALPVMKHMLYYSWSTCSTSHDITFCSFCDKPFFLAPPLPEASPCPMNNFGYKKISHAKKGFQKCISRHKMQEHTVMKQEQIVMKHYRSQFLTGTPTFTCEGQLSSCSTISNTLSLSEENTMTHVES